MTIRNWIDDEKKPEFKVDETIHNEGDRFTIKTENNKLSEQLDNSAFKTLKEIKEQKDKREQLELQLWRLQRQLKKWGLGFIICGAIIAALYFLWPSITGVFTSVTSNFMWFLLIPLIIIPIMVMFMNKRFSLISVIGSLVVIIVGYQVVTTVSQTALVQLNSSSNTDNVTMSLLSGLLGNNTASSATVFAGFSLIAVSIIVLAAFGIINVCK